MLVASAVVFTIVALLGLSMAADVFKGRSSSTPSRLAHVSLALLGSALVIIATFFGDHRLLINIALALIIIPLGLVLCYKRSKGVQPKGLVIVHGGLAVGCFVILAYFAFGPK
jgi:multisubunit Na+/H+ antiporter MnhG subunit